MVDSVFWSAWGYLIRTKHKHKWRPMGRWKKRWKHGETELTWCQRQKRNIPTPCYYWPIADGIGHIHNVKVKWVLCFSPIIWAANVWLPGDQIQVFLSLPCHIKYKYPNSVTKCLSRSLANLQKRSWTGNILNYIIQSFIGNIDILKVEQKKFNIQ